MGRVGLVLGSLLVGLSSAARAQCPEAVGGFAVDVAAILRHAENAHRTNTKEEFRDALESGADWLEGDVRVEINHADRLEMRHDAIHESGDNLSLEEWLTRGKKSGRGLKIDVKTGSMKKVLETVARVGVPSERLMFNLGDTEAKDWGEEIRRRHPEAIVAINPRVVAGEIDIARMIAHAKRIGGRVTFVLNENQVTGAALARLQEHGPVSIWGQVSDPEKRTRELRREGVDGMIGLDSDSGPGVVDALDAAKNHVRTWFDGL